MKKYLFEKFSAVDQFSEPNTLRLKNNDRYKTGGGAFATLIVILITLVSFIYLLNDMYARKNPFVLSKSEEVLVVDPIYFGPKNFFILAGLVNFNEGSIVRNLPNKNYYNVTFNYNEMRYSSHNGTQQQSRQVSQIPSVLCATQKIDMNLIQGINPSMLELGYCPDYSYWQNLTNTLHGTQISQSFTYFSVNINKCINGTSDVVCATQDEIDAVFGPGSAVGAFYTDYREDQSTPGNPYKPIIKSNSYINQKGQSYNVENYYKVSQTITTENFFYYFGNEFTDKTFQYQSSQTQNLPITDGDGQSVLTLSFFLSSELDTTKRTYTNILNIFGAVGGLLNILMLIFSIIIKPFVQFQQNFDLLKLYFFYRKPNKEKQVQVKQQDINDKNFNARILTVQAEQNISQMQLNFMEYMMLITNKQKKKTIKTGINEICKQIDIETYLIKMQEIDNLKALLLTEEQQSLMHFIMKPELKAVPQPEDKYEVLQPDKTKDHDPTLKNLVESYRTITSDENPINQKLISMLNPDIQLILEQAAINRNRQETTLLPLNQLSSKLIEDQKLLCGD